MLSLIFITPLIGSIILMVSKDFKGDGSIYKEIALITTLNYRRLGFIIWIEFDNNYEVF